MFEGILGHKKQLELLGKAFESGKLAHAYVFAGPEGVGKKTVAQKLAWRLLAPSPVADATSSPARGEDKKESSFHPDLLEINGSEGIKIDQIRELIYKLSLKPYQAPNKVAIIDNADQMTIEAANALLKSLEEPKGYTYIFLITSNPNRLPKTILSRSQKLNFGPLDQETTQAEETEQALVFLQTFLEAELPDKLISAYEIADLETEDIKKLLDFWLSRLEKLLNTQASKNLAKKIAQVLQARKFLDQNANSKLLLTNLMLSTN